MLDAIGDVVTRFDLVQVRLPGVIFFRVRVDDASKSHATAADLGPPPREKATRANRMSPAGIVMFYGAFDRKTAIWETWDFKQTVWIAQFRSLRALRLLDLSQLPGIPSIYDQDHREEIAELAFLHDFEAIARTETSPASFTSSQANSILHVNPHETAKSRFLISRGAGVSTFAV